MHQLLALMTSDHLLVRCELDRVRTMVAPFPQDLTVGMGAYDDDVVCLRRYGANIDKAEAWNVPPSDVAMFEAQSVPLEWGVEENTAPFRHRQWLFSGVGTVDSEAAVRERLMQGVPDFLGRVVRGRRLGEAVFAAYLTELREVGRMEDARLDSPLAAQLLGRTLKRLQTAAADAGTFGRPAFSAVASNGQLLVAARVGQEPLFFTLLEGESTCVRCGLDAGTVGRPEHESLSREHRRRKTVVLASNPARAQGWQEIPDGSALCVTRSLDVQLLRAAV